MYSLIKVYLTYHIHKRACSFPLRILGYGFARVIVVRLLMKKNTTNKTNVFELLGGVRNEKIVVI